MRARVPLGTPAYHGHWAILIHNVGLPRQIPVHHLLDLDRHLPGHNLLLRHRHLDVLGHRNFLDDLSIPVHNLEPTTSAV